MLKSRKTQGVRTIWANPTRQRPRGPFAAGLEQTVMSKSQVLESLRTFFPYITAREVKDLVGPGNLSLEKLKHLLFHPDVPVRARAQRACGWSCMLFTCALLRWLQGLSMLEPCVPYL